MRGSAPREHLRRAYKRKLLNKTEVIKFQELIEELTPKLSAYINSIGRKATSNKQQATGIAKQ